MSGIVGKGTEVYHPGAYQYFSELQGVLFLSLTHTHTHTYTHTHKLYVGDNEEEAPVTLGVASICISAEVRGSWVCLLSFAVV